MKLILASASPRRHELLKYIRDDFEIIVGNFDESIVPFTGDFGEYVKALSKGKALEVANSILEDVVVIGADTIVAFENQVLGKPKDENHAFEMLKSLSGNTHFVYSGITVLKKSENKVISDFVCTEIKFSKLTDSEIWEYVKTGEPLDKAGAYGIQGKAGVFVEKIEGCYYNVVGLPLNRLKNVLRNF